MPRRHECTVRIDGGMVGFSRGTRWARVEKNPEATAGSHSPALIAVDTQENETGIACRVRS